MSLPLVRFFALCTLKHDVDSSVVTIVSWMRKERERGGRLRESARGRIHPCVAVSLTNCMYSEVAKIEEIQSQRANYFYSCLE